MNNEISLSDNIIRPGTRPAGVDVPPGQTRINSLAIVAAVCAALGFLTAVGFIAGIVFGHMALSRIKRSEGRESGRLLARTALVVSWIPVALVLVLMGLLMVAGLVTAG